MTAFNIVRFKVQPGQQERFIEAHRKARPNFEGFRGGVLVKTGEQTFCIIGEWASFSVILKFVLGLCATAALVGTIASLGLAVWWFL